jgi:flagellin-like protein
MRRFRGHGRGLAEIVGTLMLVLIVVVAVTAFSLFVASYQAQVQAEEAAAHDRSLEDIRILSVSTVLNTTNLGANYSSFTFVAGSLDVNTMAINELAVNGQVVNFYTVTPLGSSSVLEVCEFCNRAQSPFQNTEQEFNLTSLEQVAITVNLTTWTPASLPHGGFLSFYNLASFGPTDFLSISLYTALGNDFNRVFAAPTAIALTEQSEIYSNGVDTPVVVFDGSESIIPTNDTIVSWTWTITDPTDPTWTLPGGGNDLVGEKALVPQSAFTTGDSYSAVLTVISAVGLAGTATLQYTQS